MAAMVPCRLPQGLALGRNVKDGTLCRGRPRPAARPVLQEEEEEDFLATSKRQRSEVTPRSTTEVKKLQRVSQLVLVLDLDHTLLHTIPKLRLASGEAHLLRRPSVHEVQQQQMLFDLSTERLGINTKIRPFVRSFLREASAMHSLRICTKGNSAYAHRMACLLDPDDVYFADPHSIVAREDFKEKDKKSLDVVPGADERLTVILDDTADVWVKHLDNLVRVPAYGYFAFRSRPGEDQKSFAEAGLDEDETAGALAKALVLLRRIHQMFFLDHLGGAGGDVREVLRRLREMPAKLRVPRPSSAT